MYEQNYGIIQIKLAELIEQRGISKNKLSHRAEMQRSQINQYCNIRSLVWIPQSWQEFALL